MASDTATRTLAFGPIAVRYDESVITPRPWTLSQSEWVADVAPVCPPGPILELCSGAGHIGLAAAVLTGRPLVQVDANPSACELAQVNARDAGRSAVVDVRCGWLAEMIAPDERFPIVIADPPYVPSRVVGRFDDPALAIDGGRDGLEGLIECGELADRHLVPGGLLSLQVRGPGQWQNLRRHLPDTLRLVECRSYGTDRAVVHMTRV